MDLDKLKANWKSIEPLQSDDHPLNQQSLKRVIGKKYDKTFFKMAIPEVLVAALYLYLLVFILVFNRYFTGTWLQVLAIMAIVLLLAIPIFSLTSFFRYYRTGKLAMPVVDALETLKKQGELFMKTQYLLLVLNLILMADLIVLVPIVYSENLDSIQKIVSVVIGAVIITILSILIWIYYKKKIARINEYAQNMV